MFINMPVHVYAHVCCYVCCKHTLQAYLGDIMSLVPDHHNKANITIQSHTMDFPVIIYGCEGWTIKKAEH